MQTLNRINITSHASSWLEIFNLNEFNQQKNKKQKCVHSAADTAASCIIEFKRQHIHPTVALLFYFYSNNESIKGYGQ